MSTQLPSVVLDPAVVLVTSISCSDCHSDLLEFRLADARAAQPVKGAVTRGRLQPRRRTRGHSVSVPALERPLKRVLRALLGQIPVAGHPDQVGNDPTPVRAKRRRYRRPSVG